MRVRIPGLLATTLGRGGNAHIRGSLNLVPRQDVGGMWVVRGIGMVEFDL